MKDKGIINLFRLTKSLGNLKWKILSQLGVISTKFSSNWLIICLRGSLNLLVKQGALAMIVISKPERQAHIVTSSMRENAKQLSNLEFFC